MTAIALIPARGGSKRVARKNIRPLAGVPLLAYTICAARDSGCFEKILVSSDDTETLDVAARYGADCIRRPDEYATDTSPDIEWVAHAVYATKKMVIVENKRPYAKMGDFGFDTFAILRPTSPFRMPETIQRAFADWSAGNAFATEYGGDGYSSLRAVSPVSEHPGKTWRIVGDELTPVLLQPSPPFHDQQLASLPPVYVQNASLEIAWTSTVEKAGTISGDRIMPFVSEGYEGFDLNTERDWLVAEQMVTDGVPLPEVSVWAE